MSASILENEILEQPIVLRRLLAQGADQALELISGLRGKFHYILIAARGSSDNAARYAQYLFQIVNQIPVALATPSVFSVYQKSPNLEGALVLGISQSGKSPDVVSVLETARAQKRPTVAITNIPGSPLEACADHVLALGAGPELSVAATKTYTSSLAAVALLSAVFSGKKGLLKELSTLPHQVESTLALSLALTARMERYRFMQHGAVIGRGYNYCTAFEVALKLKELTGVTTVPYSSADFLHGPVASLHKGYPLLAVAPSGVMYRDTAALIRKARRLGAELVVISDREEVLGMAQLAMPLAAGTPEWLSPIPAVIPGQVLAWQMALARGLDPDHPKGLSKITETF
ncbi:MAG TPA: SIS domain-containing protein [Anaerolineaceae bacterium]|jgi:glucosamine--fructose-6-phosphate aminotransferase (isomerizing)|nr:SIS domain-containing protein [Anaerolineaceae bacterium]NMD26394.1 SIS domain-containing protein [Chloroflexota bacterium]HOA21471.1 SIS domain-containing protein [Anaerolineaceae bacterium]HOG77203.1 SIS domain-containing protein [Anaerolineaceae bacterium]